MNADPAKEPPDEVLDHDYDGIQEYDNPIPGWMKALFFVTIACAVVYVVFYGFNLGPSIQSEYLAESRTLEAEWAAYYAEHPITPPSAEQLAAAAQNPQLVAAGKQQFLTSCAACHGGQGEGLIGPNLTDDYWLHGGKLTDIYATVASGVAGKGMPPWGRALAPDRLKGVVAFISTLQGTNPPGGKPPQGEQVAAEPGAE
jgi:cytochrome c oxidase cbb3-type subunit 3